MSEEEKNIGKITRFRITTAAALNRFDIQYQSLRENEIIPYARNTRYVELAQNVVPDKAGPWVNPLLFFECRHLSRIGARELCKKTREYLERCSSDTPLEILSLSAGMEGDLLTLIGLVRMYGGVPNLNNLYEYLGEFKTRKDKGPQLVVPEQYIRTYTQEEIDEHARKIAIQQEALDNSNGVPFLNAIDEYTPAKLSEIDERQELIYDLLTKDMQSATSMTYENFIDIFQHTMRYINTVERTMYVNVLKGEVKQEEFMRVVEAYIRRTYVDAGTMPEEDMPVLLAKIERALFQLYIVQDLIDDPDITDIKITSDEAIRVRVKGKAYLSNVHFIDREDYYRFVEGTGIKNNIDLKIPTQTFTDEHDEQYILRFSITAPYITSSGLPIMHIRKVPRKKLMADDLIKVGMFDEKIRDYLLDCGKYSRGVVFAGPPGSGKTVILNWFLEEAYESSAEILVIQENDELFCYREGVMFEHVVNNPQRGEQACSLEDLGRMALVAGANVFVIGEAKGAEICSAITLSNSGCRTAITIHSPSSTETIDKMADLAMRGYATSYEQAKRMIKSFQTIVYLSDFKVQEISEIMGYDEKKKDMIYRPIYRRDKE